ncbi:response regulator [Geobacter sp. OR-1]|uniref:response regulator n=1 Tax=Geobacter sp. OR-1 TaxID=1266765 RepID=UPI0006944F78|nr:response regulator [Geobacter sp. OR-1]
MFFSPTTSRKKLVTDEQRTLQILKNLLSNAVKFTSEGELTLKVFIPDSEENPLSAPAIAFTVEDTGIGIPENKIQQIFQAFIQADGSTSRRYGGTGLGLSISLQLAKGLGGELVAASEEGKGSSFSLYLPMKPQGQDAALSPGRPVLYSSAPVIVRKGSGPQPIDQPPVHDDRSELNPGDQSILIIEDDLPLARIVMDMVRERGHKVLVASDGESGFVLADSFRPSAIVLDVILPGMDGWQVMQKLKDNPRTRHIPVHFLTCMEERNRAMTMGAVGYISKPADGEKLQAVFGTIEKSMQDTVKRLLIVEDDETEAQSMVELLSEKGVEITVAVTGSRAMELLSRESFDVMVLDLGLTDMSGFELLEQLCQLIGTVRLPVIIHSGKDLSHEDERRLRHYAESIIIKGARSPERLLNEVSLFLHLVEERLPAEKQKMIRASVDLETVFDGKRILLVDDDMRNLFSLTNIFSEKQMVIFEAENGRKAMTLLKEHPDIDIVLMDIMMPEMDGYTAIREIRRDSRFAELPVIAMTAKALKGDFENCITAGASDYIAKPINVDKLVSLLRVWLYRQG